MVFARLLFAAFVALLVGCDHATEPRPRYTPEEVEASRVRHLSVVRVEFFCGPYETLHFLFQMPNAELSTAEALMPREIIGPNGYRYIRGRIVDGNGIPGESAPGQRRTAMYRHDCGDAPCSCGWEEP